ncbi:MULTISPECIES: elongation factor P maturation arginine rhamnosyltransferase EarP [Methylotenera]|uniref:elongation factor P maturation arginine rhamnosyltransferase EarP n=1 Tax=Methylotenera TaxID=359407 RepID=UPI00035E0E54|nr:MULTISPECIES: elongation factor P maturation arginine rhamnosyltransferase EarP [Methylotenera]
MLKPKLHWDIFCKIVDNFGDIGVCWRLTKQLQSEHNLSIRLFIDDLQAAQKIIPNLNVNLNQQIIDGICVLSWGAETDFTDVADVVIEAFACKLPAEYLSAMARKKSESDQQTTWVNLEYLSAESWVADFHAKPSPQANGLTRHFYFPGFTENTGGLIRESHLFDENQKLVNSESCQNTFWQALNLTNNNHLKVSLFCYPHVPIESLLTVLAESNRPIECYVPTSSILPKVGSFFGLTSVSEGKTYQFKSLNLHVLPFLSQTDYDQLLTACDINFVRGEDSWVRAIWAGKPFIWQPYFQEENTHIQKLTAFLALFYANFDTKNVVSPMHNAWVNGQLTATIWQDYLNQLPEISADTLQQSQQLAKQTDLAAKLVIFCNKN